MRVNEKLKLNKFRPMAIPSPRVLFARYGFITSPGQQYTGDEPALLPQNKVDQLQDFQKYANMRAKEMEPESDSD